MRVIDAHLHLWDPERFDYAWLDGPLRARFAADELGAARLGAASEHAVFVQADCRPDQAVEEARWVASLAERTGVRAIVAGARLDRGADTTAQLAALAEVPFVVGVRHLLQGQPDGLATTPAFLAGAAEVADRGWVFDACVCAAQLPDVVALAQALPGLRIVLDHLGKPAIGSIEHPRTPDIGWIHAMRALAAQPAVVCKLSGLPAESARGWSVDQVLPFLDVALDAFGPDRLLWGSDWPVSAVAAALPEVSTTGRARWLAAVVAWAESRGQDVDAVLWRTAARVYGID